jgi:hypothetical protein
MDANNLNGISISSVVIRADGEGCRGQVTSISEDPVAKGDERGITVGVQWDNGTFSYFTPEALKPAAKK